MMAWWFTIVVLAAGRTVDPATDAGWSEVVSRATHPVAARWTAEEAAPYWEEACQTGRRAACAVRDGAAVDEALAVLCPFDAEERHVGPAGRTEVDPASCLGRYWLTEPSDPAGAAAGYRTLCRDGFEPACAEVARAHLDGLGTYPSRRRARKLAEPLCDDGLASACVVLGRLDRANRPRLATQRLQRAVELGDGAAVWEKVSMLPTVEAANQARRTACEQGQPLACLDLAEQSATPDADADTDASSAAVQGWIGRACALGHPEGCLRTLLWEYEYGGLAKAALRASLDTMCADYEEACIYSSFLGFGGDVRSFFPGTYPDTERHRVSGQIVPFARDCLRDYRDRVPQGPTEVDLTLEMWLDEEGQLRGVVPISAADRTYEECVAEAALAVKTSRLPDGGAAWIQDAMTLGLEADATVHTFKGASGSEQAEDMEALLYASYTGQANACYMENGGSAWDEVFTWIYGEIGKNGSFEGTRLIESTGDAPTDACLLDMLQGIDLERTYEYNEKVRVYMRFNIVYRAPRQRGRNYGTAADPDSYMYEDGEIPPGWDGP